MNELNPQTLRCIKGFLSTLCGLLFLFMVYEMGRPYKFFSTTPAIEPDIETVMDTQYDRTIKSVPPEEVFSEITERPLFMEDRRPFVAPVSTQTGKRKRPRQTEPDILTLISLSAIVITKDKRIALIEDNRTRKLHQLRQGERFSGWTLTDIGTNSVAMRKGPNTRNLELVVKPPRTAQEKPQDTKREGIDEEARIASPTNVSENGDNTK